jgi:hypothetical protein
MLGNGWVNTFPWQLIHGKIEELLNASFLRGAHRIKRREGDEFLPGFLVIVTM